MRPSDFLTAQQIAEMTGWSVGYVYNLAASESWRRLPSRPVMYYLPDVVNRGHG